MEKAIYLPTNENTIIINKLDSYVEILLNGEYKTVSNEDVTIIDKKTTLSSIDIFKENIFINCIKKPLNDILYSFNTNRLIPEPHQYKPLIKFLNSENNRVLIADEVGLGKTIEAGMIFKEIDSRENLRISLIVVPSSLTLKWKEELNIRFGEYFEIKKVNQFLSLIDDFENFSTSKLFNEKIIITYHTLRDERVMKKLENSFFEIDFLIVDEAHNMRNRKTSTFSGGEIITAISDNIVFLTATPVQNSLKDLFNILYLLDEDYFMDYDFFQNMIKPNQAIHKLIALIRNNHSIDEIKDFVRENIDADEPQKLNDIYNAILEVNSIKTKQKIEFIDNLTKSDHLSFIINRTKKKDVGRLIPRNANSVIVDITNEEKNYYDSVIDFVKFLNPETPQGFITIMPERMASSSMIASLENFKEVKKNGKLFFKDIDDLDEIYEDIDIKKEANKYLDKIIENGNLIGKDDSKFIRFIEIIDELQNRNIQQIIVFSFFKYTLNYLEIKLTDLGYSVGKIHGDFSVEERYYKIKEFKKKSFDILLSSEVGSEGLDMQFCNVVVNYDLPWNPMRVEQRIGRIDRIGQKFDKLHIFSLCIIGSIEDRILNRLYEKLDIFENSIGELEPILGNLEKQLNISELINLTQEEVDNKIHLKELSVKRQELEIKEQNNEVEKLINEDYKTKANQEDLLNSNKIEILQSHTKKIFLDYLNENKINSLELKDGSLKISSENFKKLFILLRENMSNKKTHALKHKEERELLQTIHRYKELKVNFSTNYNDDFQTMFMHINNPIISIITRDKTYSTLFANVTNNNYENCFAVIYRVDFSQIKTKSLLKTIILSQDYLTVAELDYFDFIKDCSNSNNVNSENLENVKEKSFPEIIKAIEKQKKVEEIKQNRLIDIKIQSISKHFEKQINRVKRLEQKATHENVQRMKIAEKENLIKQKDDKIIELEKQKTITSSFEILGVLRIK